MLPISVWKHKRLFPQDYLCNYAYKILNVMKVFYNYLFYTVFNRNLVKFMV